jgi:hypothetical protein
MTVFSLSFSTDSHFLYYKTRVSEVVRIKYYDKNIDGRFLWNRATIYKALYPENHLFLLG